MRIAIAQINPIVGDLAGNVELILAAARAAQADGADLLVTPELALTGYPPRDLLDRPGFINDCLKALETLIAQSGDLALLVGTVASANEGLSFVPSGAISNAAVLMHQGNVIACHRKMLLPSYDVFDETRYFVPGRIATVASFGGLKLGLSICEDIWDETALGASRYSRDPVAEAIADGAHLLINLSASPFDAAKPSARADMLRRRATTFGTGIVRQPGRRQ
jgi:NAD+ synthase (glutamine-hydrolysing)